MMNKIFVILFALVASVSMMAQLSFYPTSGNNTNNGASWSSQSPVFGSMSEPVQLSTTAAQSLNDNMVSVNNDWIPAEPEPLSSAYASMRRESGPRRGNHGGEDYPGTPGDYNPQPIADIPWAMALLVLGYACCLYVRSQRCRQNED